MTARAARTPLPASAACCSAASSAPTLRVPLVDGRRGAVRQPRPRGERAVSRRGARRGRRAAALVRQRAPRRRVRLAGVHRACYERARETVRPVRRRAAPTTRGVHPQHHRRAEPAGRARARGTTVRAASTPSTTPTLLPWRGPPGAAAPPRPPATPSRRSPRRSPPPRPARAWSWSPARPTSPASCGRSPSSPRSRTRHGARVVLDAAQLAPHRPVDIAATRRRLRRALRAQAVRAVRRRRAGRPRATGCDAADAVPGRRRRDRAGRRRRRRTAVPGPPARTGTRPARPNVVGAHALAAACETLAPALGRGRRARGGAARPAARRASPRIPGVRSCASGRTRRPGRRRAAFTVDGHDRGLVAAYLSAEHGIGVRDGAFCAHPLTRSCSPAPRDGTRAARQPRPRHHRRARRPARRRAAHAGHATARAGTTRWSTAGGRPTPDPRPLPPFLADASRRPWTMAG